MTKTRRSIFEIKMDILKVVRNNSRYSMSRISCMCNLSYTTLFKCAQELEDANLVSMFNTSNLFRKSQRTIVITEKGNQVLCDFEELYNALKKDIALRVVPNGN